MDTRALEGALDQAVDLLLAGAGLEDVLQCWTDAGKELGSLLQVSADLCRLTQLPARCTEGVWTEPDWTAYLATIPQQQPRRARKRRAAQHRHALHPPSTDGGAA